MKDGIHPDYHEITVTMTDGTSYKTRSTYGKPGDTLRLDIDPKSHPAWTGGQHRLLDTGGQLARFNRRRLEAGLEAIEIGIGAAMTQRKMYSALFAGQQVALVTDPAAPLKAANLYTVVGQPEAVAAVSDAVRRVRAGIADPGCVRR